MAGSSRALTTQVGAGFGPDGLAANGDLRDHVELPSPRVIAQVGCPNAEGEALIGAQRTLLADAVADVDEARHCERKRGVDHQGDGQRKAEHVWVGGRQHVGLSKTANLRITRQPVAIDHDIAKGKLGLR